jgi:uncharacterized membrane protein
MAADDPEFIEWLMNKDKLGDAAADSKEEAEAIKKHLEGLRSDPDYATKQAKQASANIKQQKTKVDGLKQDQQALSGGKGTAAGAGK